MHNIIQINCQRMQNGEIVGLFEKLGEFTALLTSTEIAPSVAAYKSALNVLVKHVTAEYTETVGAMAKRIHEERKSLYTSLCYMVKGLRKNLDTNLSSLGEKYWAYISKNDNPRLVNQDKATRAINAVLEAFQAVGSEELESAGLAAVVKSLAAKQAEYIAAAKSRGEKKDSRVEHATRLYRTRCYEAFMALAYHACAMATNRDDAECSAFIEQANGEIQMRKEKVEARINAAKKEAKAKAAAATAANADAGSNVTVVTASGDEPPDGTGDGGTDTVDSAVDAVVEKAAA